MFGRQFGSVGSSESTRQRQRHVLTSVAGPTAMVHEQGRRRYCHHPGTYEQYISGACIPRLHIRRLHSPLRWRAGGVGRCDYLSTSGSIPVHSQTAQKKGGSWVRCAARRVDRAGRFGKGSRRHSERAARPGQNGTSAVARALQESRNGCPRPRSATRSAATVPAPSAAVALCANQRRLLHCCWHDRRPHRLVCRGKPPLGQRLRR